MVNEDGFARRAEQLRQAGAKYLFLKTGAYRFADLARALAYSSKYGVDVLTIDVAGGGTGMSPWRMMNEWGTLAIETFAKVHEYASKLDQADKHIPEIVFAGGFSLEDHIFKGIAIGVPYVKAIGMARAPITAYTASEALFFRVVKETNLKLLEKYGRTKEEIFFGSLDLKPKLSPGQFEELPAGGLGVYTYFMRISQGLRQLLAGARKLKLHNRGSVPGRNDVAALTVQAARVSGISYVSEHDRDIAENILSSVL